jgi:serine protease Do
MKPNRIAGLVLAAAVTFSAGPAWGVSPILKELEDTFIQLGEQSLRYVVNIDVTSRMSVGMGDSPHEDLFRLFGLTPEGEGPEAPQRRERNIPVPSQGSGFIFDKDGHILTNNHVIRDADEIEVTLWNGRTYTATTVGVDPQTDVAVIKIEPDIDLPVATLGNSDQIKAGQFAIAIGSPQGLEGSLSFGHITALGRQNLRLPPELRFQDFIQTDAAINLGNSGGPLINIEGEVVGINSAIVFGANSLGFAIPINLAKKNLEQLIAKGRVSRGYLGVRIQDAAPLVEAENLPDSKGALVVEVQANTPAAKGGVEMYDVIRSVDGKSVETANHLMTLISDYAPGSTVNVTVWRKGEIVERQITLEEFPDQVAQVTAPAKADVLGIQVQAIPSELLDAYGIDEGVGVLARDVDPSGPAYRAGVRPGDVILEIGREIVSSEDSFRSLVDKHAKPGASFSIRVGRRGGASTILPVEVPASPSN